MPTRFNPAPISEPTFAPTLRAAVTMALISFTLVATIDPMYGLRKSGMRMPVSSDVSRVMRLRSSAAA